MKTAAQMAANWQQAMQSPTTSQRYKDGIAGTTVNPMALAAAPDAQQRYANNTALAVSSGRMAAKLNAVDPNTWKNNAINIGAGQFSSGAQKAKGKVTNHFNKWQPIYGQSSAAAHALPKGGAANALARVAANMQVLMAAAGTA